jgi:predicted DNA-binding protein
MEITTPEELLEFTDAILDYLTEREDVFYLALDVAHQLRDELMQATSEELDIDN